MATTTERVKQLLKITHMISTMITVLRLWRVIYWYILRRRTKIEDVYGKRRWCLITDVSSNIGETFAYKLGVEYGYKVIMIGPREDKLKELEHKIKRYNRESIIISMVYDLSQLGTEQEKYGKRLEMKVSEIVREEGLSFLVHIPGEDDIAYQFTDLSPKRNYEVMNVSVCSTLLIMQNMIPLLTRTRMNNRKSRAAVITLASLTSFQPTPTFTCSSGNNQYIRGFTLSASMEYNRDGIDILCAYPILVESKLFNHRLPGCITANRFVDGVLGDLGQINESTGYWLHDLIVLGYQYLPPTVIDKIHYVAVSLISNFVESNIDGKSFPLKLRVESS